MAMDSWFHKVEPMLGERAAHGQPTARLGTVVCLIGLKMSMCFCILLLKNEWIEIWVEISC